MSADVAVDLADAASVRSAADAAIDVLRRGGTVVLPTDTVYGIAANPTVAGATDALFTHKERAADVPIAVLCASALQALALADIDDDRTRAVVRDLASLHWPGALTLVLGRHRAVTWELGEPSATIGLRVPAHPLIAAIAAEVGPLATTSANRHGQPTPATAPEAAASLVGDVDLVIDGPRLEGAASTVARVVAGEIEILRQGPIILDT